MEIPKIIHQTWKNEEIPLHFEDSVNSWKNNHQDWEYKLWTDEMNVNFIEEYFPDFLDIYNKYEHTIQKVDAVRYFILYQFGGVYVDLDFHCFKNINSLITKADCTFGLEHESHWSHFKKNMIISNAFMASIPKAKFMKLICDELFDPSFPECKWENYMILESTGPFMLTRIYEKYINNTILRPEIIEPKYLYPLAQNDINEEVINNIKNNKFGDALKDAYALHYYWGTWWK